MQKKILFTALIIVTALSATALAKQPLQTATNTKSEKTISIPEKAIEMAPHVFSLGEAVDPESGLTVEGYAIVTPRTPKTPNPTLNQSPAKPGTSCGNGICEVGENADKCPSDCGGTVPQDPAPTSSCYGFMAKDAKWKSIEPWVVNGENNSGIDPNYIFTNLSQDIAQWEDATDGQLNDGHSQNIFGEGILTVNPLLADTTAPDGQNEVYFGSIEDNGAIAITIVWGVFGGAPKNRVLVEWDQVYDEVDFAWSANGEPDKMDFWNIAIHELGHSFGLSDLYTAECSQETMYGYASEGEINKQDLNTGDIAGISNLY